MLDEKDLKILEELKTDARQSTADISRKTKIPRVTVHERIQKLRKIGVIEKFTVKLSGQKIGMPTVAFVMVKALPNVQADQNKLAQDIARIPEVLEAYSITGEWDFILKIRAENIEEIGRIVVNRVRQVKGVERTFTISTFSELKSE